MLRFHGWSCFRGGELFSCFYRCFEAFCSFGAENIDLRKRTTKLDVDNSKMSQHLRERDEQIQTLESELRNKESMEASLK